MPYTEPTSFTGCPFVITGAGTLGRCIALLMWLTRGETVHLFDTNAVTLEAAQSTSTPNSMASSSASSPAPRTVRSSRSRIAQRQSRTRGSSLKL
ncbi:hypothetical protein FIBSPDRAFT_35824 [Athelia psychrophila]|uniref:3-hydroxyacyl-CoA dehydrogenase NAD binding domain-containing protein n=1 Tax=Athelia psychrophila TaxID=1759441 RepID=A0A166FS84_9AGAM|nr:hypothetical protein FIBSPDRAFT_35824 [Fibularhizoctonia sp. CBS 109695]